MNQSNTPRWLWLLLVGTLGSTILFAALFVWALAREKPAAIAAATLAPVVTVDVEATVLALVAGTQTAAPPLAATPAGPTPDLVATVFAAVEATMTAQPTATAFPTATPSSVPPATPNLTATAIAGCTVDATLVSYHTYRDPRYQSAPVGATFPVSWTLENSGTCAWPAGWLFAYESGATFGGVAPVVLEAAVLPGDQVDLTAPNWAASTTARRLEASWQLQEAPGAPVGPVIAFDILIYLPPSPTPATPTATPTGEATEITDVGFNIFPNNDCEYPGGGTEWRCAMMITPFGGGGGPYTLWVFDGLNGQPVEYFGGNQTHFITSRRCSPWVHEIKVQDEVTGISLSQDIFVSPLNLSFAVEGGGGCTEPN